MTKTYKFIYEIELPTMNQIIDMNRRNHFAGAKQKRQYTDLIAFASKKYSNKTIEKKVDVYCCWYCKNKMTDKDNISAGLKFVLDGLQRARILKNDGWKEIGDIHHLFFIDKKRPRLELELVEIDY